MLYLWSHYRPSDHLLFLCLTLCPSPPLLPPSFFPSSATFLFFLSLTLTPCPHLSLFLPLFFTFMAWHFQRSRPSCFTEYFKICISLTVSLLVYYFKYILNSFKLQSHVSLFTCNSTIKILLEFWSVLQ